MTCQ